MGQASAPRRASRWLTAGAAVAWMALIFRLSALPGSDVPGRFGPLGHFALYAVLGGLYFAALDPTGRSTRAATVAIALASAYGITDEYHQYFVPGRTNDPVDWLVDTAGAAAAVTLIAWAAHRRERGTQ